MLDPVAPTLKAGASGARIVSRRVALADREHVGEPCPEGVTARVDLQRLASQDMEGGSDRMADQRLALKMKMIRVVDASLLPP